MARQTTLEDRSAIAAAMKAKEAVRETAQRLQWRESTIHKWRRKLRSGGAQALETAMGRPAQGAMSSQGEEMREHVLRLRARHPGWGPKTLHMELRRDPAFAGQKIPSAATIGRLLKATALSVLYEPHVALPPPAASDIAAAHERWEMDARGHERIDDVGVVALIDINDRFSHLRILSYPCVLGERRADRHASTEDYQTALRLAFLDWGMPRSIQVDHDSVFYDNKSRSPYPTRFHLWLIALGIDLTFGRPNIPKDQAMTERSHQLWDKQVLSGQSFTDWQELFYALLERRTVLNACLPCRSLNERTILEAFPEATHSQRHFALEHEAELLDLDRIDAYLARGRWYRWVGDNGTLSLGGYTYSVGYRYRGKQLEITFDAISRCLTFAGHQQPPNPMPIQGITIQQLMNNSPYCPNLPALQFALPFSWDERRLLRLYEFVNVR